MCEAVGSADGHRRNASLGPRRASPRRGLAASPGRDAGGHPPSDRVPRETGGGGVGGRAPARVGRGRRAGRARTGARHLLVATRPGRRRWRRRGDRRPPWPARACRDGGRRGGRGCRRRPPPGRPAAALPLAAANRDHGRCRMRAARCRSHRRPRRPSRRGARRPALPPGDPPGGVRPLSVADRASRHQPALDGSRCRRPPAGGRRGADGQPRPPQGGDRPRGAIGGGAHRHRPARRGPRGERQRDRRGGAAVDGSLRSRNDPPRASG